MAANPKYPNGAPLRKLVACCSAHPRTRRGIVALVTLECGHLERANASERRRGRVYCFDCYYDQPQHPQAIITLDEFRAAS